MTRIVVLCAAFLLAGCAQQIQEAKTAWNITTGATITPNEVYVAANAFDALEASATTYLRLPVCGKAPCRNANATKPIVNAIRSGRQARNRLEAAISTNPGAPIDANLFKTLTGSNSTLKAILNIYSGAQ